MADRQTRRQRARELARDSARWPREMTQVPIEHWPFQLRGDPRAPVSVWRSRDYLVQVFSAPLPAVARISVNRCRVDGDRWADGIPWEDLQRIKNELGYAHHDAVELFPRDGDVVNVANLRHLWVMAELQAYAWRGV